MEILKKLVLNKENVAKFDNYTAGSLYYTITIEEGTYRFPVEVTETDSEGILSLSSDLGTTTFESEYKASTMMRYIRKAIKNETLLKIK